MKEQEFLTLRHGDTSILEYERRFHDFLLFASHYVPTEEHVIEKLRDGIRHELRQGLIVVQFKLVRELIKAAQALEACIGDGHQGHHEVGKKKDGDDFTSRPPLPNKRKSGVFEASKKRGIVAVLRR